MIKSIDNRQSKIDNHWSQVIRFKVAGTAAPGGSKTAFVNKKTGKAIVTDASKKTKPWQAAVANLAVMVYDGPILTGPVKLAVTFVIARPKYHWGTGRNARKLKDSAPLHVLKSPDLTKLIRALEDALTGILWRDDCLVVSGRQDKRWAALDERPGAIVTVGAWYGPLTVGEMSPLLEEATE